MGAGLNYVQELLMGREFVPQGLLPELVQQGLLAVVPEWAQQDSLDLVSELVQ